MIYRIDVRTKSAAREGQSAADPLGESLRHQIAEFGVTVGPIQTSRIFLIDTDADIPTVARIANELLADPVAEEATMVLQPPQDFGHSRIEVHLKPGVMDPVAASTEMAIRDMGLPVREVRTGRAFVFEGSVPREQLERIAARVLANGVIESLHFDAFIPQRFPAGQKYKLDVKRVPVLGLSDEQLQQLSREGHLFLSLTEMKAMQEYFRGLGREPSDIELETIAQTWSEHCVHKTLKSSVNVTVQDEAGQPVGTRHYDNLIKDTIFGSTMELMARRAQANAPEEESQEPQASPADEFCLSVFADNAGVVAFDETDAVCFKVETHNHPSAIEPYGGSATGVGGVIRDVLGTGLAAKPIANTDVFCVAFPDYGRDASDQIQNPKSKIENLPKGIIHPKRILQQIVAGVRDYGNRMGIPTLDGAVYFDNRYLGNPLVFCGCVGLIPRDKIHKQSRPGDRIVVMGGRTGRDGIHGATFSSAELTDTHADEFSHAVQIGNAVTEKKVTDVVLQARDRGLFTAITDCGAGGLSSAVGEMGEKLGARVELDKVPLKYAGLRHDEIWISEAQERMVLAVPVDKVQELLALAAGENVEATVIGHFGTENHELVLLYEGQEVGRMSMAFLHGGIPMPTRNATVVDRQPPQAVFTAVQSKIQNPKSKIEDTLLSLLSHPNIASKHWIIRQYDHEVQGGSVVKPLLGPLQAGPSDAAVIRPKLASTAGLALGCGLAPHVEDPYYMALASIDEAVRNVVAVGADPGRTAILDNFCWPSVDDEKTMGTLVRACEACRDVALAYGIPFISGKDSLHNQFTNQETGEVIRIPNTLLISAMAIVPDVRRCVTMDLKRAGNELYRVTPAEDRRWDAAALIAVHRAVAQAIGTGKVASCHDISDGGSLVAAAEMAIASGLGLEVGFYADESVDALFAEAPGSYLLEIGHTNVERLRPIFDAAGASFEPYATVTDTGRLVVGEEDEVFADLAVEELTKRWQSPLDW